jgi:hypothetical protein
MKALARRGAPSRIDVPGMRPSRFAFVLLVGVLDALFVCPPSARGAETTSASVAVRADLATRTSLKVSAQTLQFEVSGPEELPVVEIEFSAGARTRMGGEVLLTAELIDAVACLDHRRVTVTGAGAGTIAAALTVGTAIPVARWIGSGLRTGRLTFTVPTPSTACAVPVRFVLSTP